MLTGEKGLRGFTLIELMIVIGVLAVIMAIARPGIKSWMVKSRLSGGARQVMSDLMYARMKSASQNNNFKVTRTSSTQYTILDDTNGNGSADTGETLTSRDIKTNFSDVTISGASSITFRPRGDVDQATTFTVTNSAGYKNITVSLAGRVKID